MSMHAYLNNLLKHTLDFLWRKQHPTALACWLQREFMLCCHDKNGRREYLKEMKKALIQPYSVDIFELGEFVSSLCFLSAIEKLIEHYYSWDWEFWWKTQFNNEYYSSCHFSWFDDIFMKEIKVIAGASSENIWDRERESKFTVLIVIHPYIYVHSQVFYIKIPAKWPSRVSEDTLAFQGFQRLFICFWSFWNIPTFLRFPEEVLCF